MKILALFMCGLLIGPVASAEFHDPMRPPPYALQKLRLDKVKKSQAKKPVVNERQNVEPWVLSSILYSGQRKHAIINNKLVRQGEVIKGARLIKLRPDSVHLKVKGKVIKLSLRSKFKSIKKSPNERKL